jgi:hypothetical protein
MSLGTSFEEDSYNVDIWSFPSDCVVQRRSTQSISQSDIGITFFYQSSNACRVQGHVLASHMKGSHLVCVFSSVDINSDVDEPLHSIDVTSFDGTQ